MNKKTLFYLTVLLPLNIRDWCLGVLRVLTDRAFSLDIMHRLLEKRGLIGFLPDGNLIVYPLDDFKLSGIIREIYSQRIYDTDEIRNLKNAYDVGAHVGLFTLRLAKLSPRCNITAIEPNPVNFRYLVKNARMNRLSHRVRALNVAVGMTKRKALLVLNRFSRGDGSIKPAIGKSGVAGSLAVEMIPLKDIISENEICDLMKIDVEGAEDEALIGLSSRYHNVVKIVMEVHIDVVDPNGINKWLLGHDFAVTRKVQLYRNCLLLEAKRLKTIA